MRRHGNINRKVSAPNLPLRRLPSRSSIIIHNLNFIFYSKFKLNFEFMVDNLKAFHAPSGYKVLSSCRSQKMNLKYLDLKPNGGTNQ